MENNIAFVARDEAGMYCHKGNMSDIASHTSHNAWDHTAENIQVAARLPREGAVAAQEVAAADRVAQQE